MINAIIMASGYSRRMGTNKLLLPYNGKTLIEHTLDNVCSCNFYNTILVAKDLEILALGKNRGMKTINNTEAVRGQSETIKLGINNLPEAMGYAFFTGDQPLMNSKTIKYLIDCFKMDYNFIVAPSYRGERGTPVIFPRVYVKELLSLRGDKGGRTVIQANLDKVKYVDLKEAHLLWDIDTKADYEKLINMKV